MLSKNNATPWDKIEENPIEQYSIGYRRKEQTTIKKANDKTGQNRTEENRIG